MDTTVKTTKARHLSTAPPTEAQRAAEAHAETCLVCGETSLRRGRHAAPATREAP